MLQTIHGIVHIHVDYDDVLIRNENPTRGRFQRY